MLLWFLDLVLLYGASTGIQLGIPCSAKRYSDSLGHLPHGLVPEIHCKW